MISTERIIHGAILREEGEGKRSIVRGMDYAIAIPEWKSIGVGEREKEREIEKRAFNWNSLNDADNSLSLGSLICYRAHYLFHFTSIFFLSGIDGE